jgi:hypothetical protein
LEREALERERQVLERARETFQRESSAYLKRMQGTNPAERASGQKQLQAARECWSNACAHWSEACRHWSEECRTRAEAQWTARARRLVKTRRDAWWQIRPALRDQAAIADLEKGQRDRRPQRSRRLRGPTGRVKRASATWQSSWRGLPMPWSMRVFD